MICATSPYSMEPPVWAVAWMFFSAALNDDPVPPPPLPLDDPLLEHAAAEPTVSASAETTTAVFPNRPMAPAIVFPP